MTTFTLGCDVYDQAGSSDVDWDSQQIQDHILGTQPLAKRTADLRRLTLGVGGEEVLAPGDWRRPDVGWGVVVKDVDAPPQLATDLLEIRSGQAGRLLPMFAPDPRAPNRLVRRGGSSVGIGTGYGTDGDAIPRFLAVVASPADVSWAVQAELSARAIRVGRLDPGTAGIEHYLAAIADGWSRATADRGRLATWSAITDRTSQVLHAALAMPAATRLGSDGADVSVAPDGRAQDLLELLSLQPGLVVTTSHGSLPSAAPQATLGVPVDDLDAPVPVAEVAAASPGGALWVIQACCSGGSTSPSVFAPLFAQEKPGSSGARTHQWLKDVEASAPLVAPLPRALLGAPQPARGVIAQVELTFDWMLVELDGSWTAQPTGAPLTGSLVSGLSATVLGGEPIGHALVDHQMDASGLMQQRLTAEAAWMQDPAADRESPYLWEAFRNDLCARNRRATVLLGDPAVAFG